MTKACLSANRESEGDSERESEREYERESERESERELSWLSRPPPQKKPARSSTRKNLFLCAHTAAIGCEGRPNHNGRRTGTLSAADLHSFP